MIRGPHHTTVPHHLISGVNLTISGARGKAELDPCTLPF